MAKVTGLNKLLSLEAYGKIGNPFGLGNFILGQSFVGEDSKHWGVYQRRKTKTSGRIIVKYAYQVPYDPATALQMESRFFFKNIIAMYHHLTYEEFTLLDFLADQAKLNVQQILVRLYQKDKPSVLGNLNIGYCEFGDLTVFG